MRRFPGIAFRGEDAMREAWVLGTGLDVWELIEMLDDYGSVERLVAETEVPARAVELARAYHANYPEEVDRAIAENRRPLSELRELLPVRRFHAGRPGRVARAASARRARLQPAHRTEARRGRPRRTRPRPGRGAQQARRRGRTRARCRTGADRESPITFVTSICPRPQPGGGAPEPPWDDPRQAPAHRLRRDPASTGAGVRDASRPARLDRPRRVSRTRDEEIRRPAGMTKPPHVRQKIGHMNMLNWTHD